MAKVTWRIPDELLEALKDQHADTFDEHRLSFNAWVVAQLEAIFTPPRRRR